MINNGSHAPGAAADTWPILALIFALDLLVKTYEIENGDFVVWDEAHFGKFASQYIRRELFSDVHPPAGKMFIAFLAYISGIDKSFEFKSGMTYPPEVNYRALRRLNALVTAPLPLLAFGIAKEFGASVAGAALSAMLFVFENGIVTMSRFVLLEPALFLTTFLTAYAFSRVLNRGAQIGNLLFLGTAIGLSTSVKWVGMLTIAYIGLYTILSLYSSLKYETFRTFAGKFVLNAVTLIALPCAIYSLCFYIHFMILRSDGSSDALMSSDFRLALSDDRSPVAKYVEYGDVMVIRASKIGGANLHSHPHKYPGCDTYNQVTTYSFFDTNNEWVVLNANDKKSGELVSDGDNVLLVHSNTKKYLSVVRGKFGFNDGTIVCTEDTPSTRSIWKVRIESDTVERKENVKTISTRFTLYSIHEDCFLTASDESYPDWGFRQGIVTCEKIPSKNSLWNRERRNVTGGMAAYTELQKSSPRRFLRNLFEANLVMADINSRLTQDPDTRPSSIVSEPSEWFPLRRGLRMTAWDDPLRHKFYMFGNPVTWYAADVAIILLPFITCVAIVRKMRVTKMWKAKKFVLRRLSLMYFSVGGWAFHYFPFFFMGRVLYFHHYYPAYMFSILTLSIPLSHHVRIFILLVIASIISFILYSPLTYGFRTFKFAEYLKLLPTWDFTTD